jgi:cyclophilin family peptidyl-prolyl cis-trans isomerase
MDDAPTLRLTPVATAPEPPPAPTPPPAPAPTDSSSSQSSQDQVVVLTTTFGKIVIELDNSAAPVTCENFRKLVSDGFYNHTVFHRVIPNFIIQGGDPNTKGDNRAAYGQGGPGYKLPAEIKLTHDEGAVAMARLPDSANPRRESNGSQFYICLEACPSLDAKYTVFGHVIKGMDVANKIGSVPRDPKDDPLDRIEMEATLESKDQALANDPGQ